jgi:hypothetical protein
VTVPFCIQNRPGPAFKQSCRAGRANAAIKKEEVSALKDLGRRQMRRREQCNLWALGAIEGKLRRKRVEGAAVTR